MIETFTRKQFEEALPNHKETGKPLWKYVGLVQGEHVYRIAIPETNKRIMIRSSVRSNGKSAGVGDDSIRLWVEYHYRKIDKWFALGKLDAWTTRKPGWQDRMISKLRQLWQLALEDSKNGGRKTQTAPVTPKSFTPSKYQEAIFEFVKSGEGHGVVGAVAGSGKTTTIVEALKFTSPDDKVAFVAFNRHIAKELGKRAPEHVHVSTLHSLGYGNIRSALDKIKVEPRKLWHVIANVAEEVVEDYGTFDILQANGQSISHLVSLCKATLREPTPENLEWIADRWSIETNGSTEIVHHLIKLVYEKSIEQTETIDYDDMIFFSATSIVPCEKFDFLFVDECQDLNKAQIAMALKSIADGGRIVAVGDAFQSIYGFRGADVDAIPNIIEALGATVLPLSISYRCPKSHVELAQRLVPHIEAADWAKEGTVESISDYKFLDKVQTGDLVLCRCNAPLIEPAFSLIRRGIKAVILGRDIGKSLMNLVKKVQKRRRVYSLADSLDALMEYGNQEVRKLNRLGKSMRAQSLRDRVETILALSDGCSTVAQLERKINQVFSDDAEGVTFSSVHKTKGGEADRVFILRPDLMPHPKAKAAWERQQERNIEYVALTRSKSELYFVE